MLGKTSPSQHGGAERRTEKKNETRTQSLTSGKEDKTMNSKDEGKGRTVTPRSPPFARLAPRRKIQQINGKEACKRKSEKKHAAGEQKIELHLY